MFTTHHQLKRLYDKANFIKPSTFDQHQHSCLICMQPLTHPLRCRGCKIQVCTVCARKWLKNKKRCPQKCRETQWALLPEKPTGVMFKCPFDERCEQEIYSETFEDHLKNCRYAPEEIRNLKSEDDLKKQYLCAEGHKLSFLGRDHLSMVQHATCSGCCLITLVRSQCIQCRTLYCCQCRPPHNLTSRHCPQNHQFLVKDSILTNSFCDYCAKRITAIGGGYCYNEPQCDFAVCMNCFELLPKERVMEAYEKQVNPPRRTEEVVAVGQVEVVEVPVTESESEMLSVGEL